MDDEYDIEEATGETRSTARSSANQAEVFTSTRTQKSSLNTGSLIIGGLVALLGLWLLGNIFKLVPGTSGFPLPVWAAILALVGVIMAGSGRRMLVPGLLLALFSGTYLFRYLGWMGVDGFHKIWLILIVLVGLMMMASGRKS